MSAVDPLRCSPEDCVVNKGAAMHWLLGIAAGAYGCVIGAIVFAFVKNARRLDVKAVGGLVTLLGGGGLLLAFEKQSIKLENADLVALSGYAIGLFLGWGVPSLLEWHRKELERNGPGN